MNRSPQLNLLHRQVVMGLLGAGLVALLSVWVTETMFGVLRPVDGVGYGLLCVCCAATMLALWQRRIEPLAAQQVVVLAVSGFLAAGLALPWVWPELGAVDIYTTASGAPWLMFIELFVFMCMARKRAVMVALAIDAAVLVPPLLALALKTPLAAQARALMPLLTNLGIALGLFGVLLYWLAGQFQRLAAWGALTPTAQREPREIDEFIDERSRALQGLLDSSRQHEAELRAMLETFPGPVMSMDALGVVRHVNAPMAQLLGQPLDSLPGRHARELLGETALQTLQVRQQRMLQSGQPERVEHGYAPPGQSPRDVLETHFAVPAQPGRAAHFFQVGIDITARRQAERAQVQARDEAERANRAKSEFLSRMSHELRTPLNAVLALSQLVRSHAGALAQEDRDHLRTIEHAGRHLSTLIDDALDLSRIEDGALHVLREPVALARLVREVVDGLATTLQAHQVSLKLQPVVGDPHALGDTVRVRQVLFNLLSNAVKYNRPGGWVRVVIQQVDQRVQVQVHDNGPGLSAAQQGQLFVAYNRLGATGGPVPGTGLGLVISRQLARLMGGDIQVHSQPGEGSCFTLELTPCHASPPPSSAPNSGLLPLDETPSDQTSRLLYIEDNAVNQMVFGACMALRPQVQLRMAGTAEEGLSLAGEWLPDVIVLDLNLPDMDGLKLADRLRQRPELAACHLALLTADATEQAMQRARDHGIRHVWHKPFDAARLLADLDALLAGTSA